MIQKLRNWWEDLNENYKRIALSIAFAVLVIFLIYAIYYVFFKQAAAPGTETGTSPIGGAGTTLPVTDIRDILEQKGIVVEQEPGAEVALILPTAEDIEISEVAGGGMTLAKPKIYSGAAAVSLTADGTLQYYNENDGKFYKIVDGDMVALSDREFPNVENVIWSPKDEEAILEFPDGTNIFYDFKNEAQSTLPREGQGFGFSGSGEQIGYKFLTNNADENWLVVSSPKGENSFAVEHIGDANPDDVLVKWSPDNSRVAMYRQSITMENEEIYFIGAGDENFLSLKVDGRGFEGQWSPSGEKLVYNVYNAAGGYRPELWITNAAVNEIGINNKKIGLNTWASKCTFSASGANAYCAVPIYLKQGSGIYPEIAANVPDVIYKINTITGYKQMIAIPTNSLGIGLFTAEKLILSPKEDVLYMQNTLGGINEIKLK